MKIDYPENTVWLDLLAVQGTLKSLLQHHSSKASIPLHPAFFRVQLSPALCSRASGFPRCSWRIRAPSPVWPRAPQVWPTGTSSCRCSVRSRGRVTRPFGLRGENQGPVPAPPLCVEPRVGPQGCQGRTHTQPLAHSVTLSLISQVVLGHEHARAGESGAFGLWPHPRGSSRISS